MDYACAVLYIFSIISWWPLLYFSFRYFPDEKKRTKKKILDTPRRALTGHRQQVHVLQLLSTGRSLFFFSSKKIGRDSWIFYLFSFVLSGTTTTNVTCSKSCVWGGGCVSSSAGWTDRNRKMLVFKNKDTQDMSEKFRNKKKIKLKCVVSGGCVTGCRYIRIGPARDYGSREYYREREREKEKRIQVKY